MTTTLHLEYTPTNWRLFGKLVRKLAKLYPDGGDAKSYACRPFGNSDSKALSFFRDTIKEGLGLTGPEHSIICSNPHNNTDRTISYIPTDYADCMVSAMEH
jgi:hypothetical protein